MKLTSEHIEQIKVNGSYMEGNIVVGMPCDMAAEIEVGCEHWTTETYNDAGYINGSVDMCRWPNGRGAICYGGNSHFGDWNGSVLVLDADPEDEVISVNERGEEV